MPLDRSSRAWEVHLELARGVTLRAALEAALREAIVDGRLAAGARLPSTRALAAQLSVSRGTVVDAYDQLIAEGALVARANAVPLVAERPEAAHEPEEPSAPPQPTVRFDLIATTPDVGLFPRAAWSRAVAQALRELPDAELDYADPRGLPVLRAALARHLARTRGVRTGPERIVVVDGYTQAIDLLCRLLARAGARRIGFEDPSLSDQWRAAEDAGLELVPLPVDADGIRVEAVEQADPDLLVVTPAHQFPTGAVLSPERRRALAGWASMRGRLVLEDDYDAEFRYDRRPVGALQPLAPDHVIQAGTVSKTLAPALRLGWLVLPGGLVDEVAAAKWAADSGSPAIDQRALAWLLEGGAIDRHLRGVRSEYRRRRDALAAELARRAPALRLAGVAAGLHLAAYLPPGLDEQAVIDCAAARGIRVQGLGAFHRRKAGARAGLVIGYGRLQLPSIVPAVMALAEALDAAGASAGDPLGR